METTAAKTSTEVLKEIGQELQNERIRHGLTCADVSSKLRITQRYIEHIEAGYASELPAMTYVIGFIRSYANLLKLDSTSLCASLKQSLSVQENNPEFGFIDRGMNQKANSGRTALAALIAGVMIYGGWYAFSTGLILAPNDQPSEQPIELALEEPDDAPLEVEATFTKVAPRVAPEVAPEIAPEIAPVQSVDDQGETELAANDAPNQNVAGQTLTQTPVVEPEVETPLIEEVASNETDANPTNLDDELKPGVTDAVATNRIPEKDIVLKATANSWVEVTRADGSAVSQRLMRTGESYVVPGGDDLFLTTGNAGGLEIQLGDAEPVVLGGWGVALRELPLDETIISQRY